MTHMHITAWALGFILFALVYMMLKQGKEKPAKITQMILRLDYLFILYTGGDLIAYYFNGSPLLPEAIIKGLAGVWIIAVMEMMLVKLRKQKSLKGLWLQFVIAVIIVLALGFFRLPMSV
ncbi:YisL family protein [Virgibacillus salarius]|uniref:YisL family protein n=1 Tax=Virgibacillus salarius TaxID=447199 RepID=UPI0031DB6ECD